MRYSVFREATLKRHYKISLHSTVLIEIEGDEADIQKMEDDGAIENGCEELISELLIDRGDIEATPVSSIRGWDKPVTFTLDKRGFIRR